MEKRIPLIPVSGKLVFLNIMAFASDRKFPVCQMQTMFSFLFPDTTSKN